jgi:hypothetical protein
MKLCAPNACGIVVLSAPCSVSSLAELATDLVSVEARCLESTEQERDVFLREILRPVAR